MAGGTFGSSCSGGAGAQGGAVPAMRAVMPGASVSAWNEKSDGESAGFVGGVGHFEGYLGQFRWRGTGSLSLWFSEINCQSTGGVVPTHM